MSKINPRLFLPATLILLAPSLLLTGALSGCSNASGITPSGDALPLWTRQATRTVDNGYIVYVESDDNPSGERAKAHAEAAALADLMNECTLIPKGVRVEDRFDHKVGPLTEAYAKVGIEMEACEEGKKAITPETIRKLANEPMTALVKKYQEQIGQNDEVLAAAEEGEPTEEGGTGFPMPTPAPGTPAQAVAVRDEEHFYIIREQVAMAKQTVVLAPATAYQPQSPEYVHFSQTIPAQSQTLASYEASHPAMKTTGHPWSYYRHSIMRPKINTGKEVKPRGQKPSGRNGDPQQGQRRGRKRHGGAPSAP